MTNVFSLTGKTILVTGASSGLGKQTALTASGQGAQVVITGRNPEKLNETFKHLDPGAKHSIHQQVVADLTLHSAIDELTGRLPVLNGVVFSVGISGLLPTKFLTGKEIEKNFNTSFNSAVLMMASLQKKKKLQNQRCSVVFISSISTRYPFVGGAMYISAKAALEAYARVLALELSPRGIRVNCVSPGFVRGPMLDQTQEQLSGEVIAKIDERQPLGIGEPEDVANTIVFFLSDASRWITGTNLFLGGG
ncbi:MAG: SDR family oxidoreductase [Bacteroidales bacterium]|nr:SDR family oxidoreductase [Bacteroidales bacterium]